MSDLGNKKIMSENIRRFMDKNNIDRNELSAAIAVPYTTLTDWLTAKTYPRIDKIERMAKYFGVTKSQLVEKSEPSATLSDSLPYVKGRRIPVLGTVHAGRPILAQENIIAHEYADVSEGTEHFFLRVKGDSMINVNIYDGSLVLIRMQNTAENGQIVVCIINGDEATLKRFYQHGDTILLQPENPKHQSILVPVRDFECGYARVIGVAVEVRTKL